MKNDFLKWFLLKIASLDKCFADIVNRKVFIFYQVCSVKKSTKYVSFPGTRSTLEKKIEGWTAARNMAIITSLKRK